VPTTASAAGPLRFQAAKSGSNWAMPRLRCLRAADTEDFIAVSRRDGNDSAVRADRCARVSAGDCRPDPMSGQSSRLLRGDLQRRGLLQRMKWPGSRVDHADAGNEVWNVGVEIRPVNASQNTLPLRRMIQQRNLKLPSITYRVVRFPAGGMPFTSEATSSG
jgi:hypothetical protein